MYRGVTRLLNKIPAVVIQSAQQAQDGFFLAQSRGLSLNSTRFSNQGGAWLGEAC